MKIVYSFYKVGEEGRSWDREVRAASNERFTFIPFNQVGYLDVYKYWDAVQLDRLHQSRNPSLLKMYADFEVLIRDQNIDAIMICDASPFHPDFLKRLAVYKVLFSRDDPESTYQRNIPYLHAYQHVLYCTPAYTADMDMADKMRYCGMVNSDLVSISTFDFDFDVKQTEKTILSHERDIDILFTGAFYWRKIELLARLKKTFGGRFQWYGYVRPKHNLYLSAKYHYPFWIRPISFEQRRLLHQRAKIGINLHNGYAVPNVGNQRLFYLPANGVMQISDGHEHLHNFFEIGKEVVAYHNADDLIEQIKYYLQNDDERKEIALNGYRRAMREYRFAQVTHRAGELIEKGMARIGWKRGT